MRQFMAYRGVQSDQVTCINDAFGKSIAVFNDFYRPGDIATRNVEHRRTDPNRGTPMTESHFRIIREVSNAEVEKLLILSGTTYPARDGWWYEVIGD